MQLSRLWLRPRSSRIDGRTPYLACHQTVILGIDRELEEARKIEPRIKILVRGYGPPMSPTKASLMQDCAQCALDCEYMSTILLNLGTTGTDSTKQKQT